MAKDLISLQLYKQLKNINSTNADASTSELINLCSDYIKAYLGRTLVDHYTPGKEKVERRKGNINKIYLSEFPLRQVVSVELKDEAGTYSTLVDGTDYFIDYEVDAVMTVDGEPFTRSLDPNAVRITYTGGYESVPSELQLATVDLVTFYLKGEYVQKKEMGGMDSISFKNLLQIEHNLPQHIARVLEMHRQSVFF